jgi:hypothetical protein
LDGQDPFKEDIAVAAWDGPEGGGGSFSDGDDVLDIKIGFNTVVGISRARCSLVGTNDLSDWLGWDVVLFFEVSEIRRRVALSKGLEEGLSGSLVLNGAGSNVVERSNQVRGGGASGSSGLVIRDNHGLLVGGWWELDGVSNEVDVRGDPSWKAVLKGTDGGGVQSSGVENEEFGGEEFFGLGNGHASDNEFTVGESSESLESVAVEESVDSIKGVLILGEFTDLSVSEVLAILGGSRVRDFPEGLLENIEVLLADSEDESDVVFRVGASSLDPITAHTVVVEDAFVSSLLENAINGQGGGDIDANRQHQKQRKLLHVCLVN